MFIAYLILAPCFSTANLDDPEYTIRDRAVRQLAQHWPLSHYVLLEARKSGSLHSQRLAREALVRGSNRLLGPFGYTVRGLMDREQHLGRIGWLMQVQPDLIRWPMVDFALDVDSRNNTRLIALWLMLAPFPDNYDGLPYTPELIHKLLWDRRDVNQGFQDLMKNTWTNADGSGIQLAVVTGYIVGLEHARFWLRGLGDPNPWGAAKDKAVSVWTKSKLKGLPKAELPEVLK